MSSVFVNNEIVAILRSTMSPITAKIKTLTALKFEICGYKETNRYVIPPPPISLCPCQSRSLHGTFHNYVSISVQSTLSFTVHTTTLQLLHHSSVSSPLKSFPQFLILFPTASNKCCFLVTSCSDFHLI
jgi:hypothetical protein